GLRPARMEAMLKDCLGVKTVRLFLALARRSSLPVLDALDLSGVRLGAPADYVMRTPGKAIRLKRS
ncbi:MAG: type IV toxin-antitoxin system AbiEi family antitoxin domain-containing protein, partial [Alphaproteobacteria bacterium]|nr:type IV toxin-antitoxin system AbiEi family antitoxin domain-containing protein [Alphaproteobacteria bacterium]